MGKINTRDQVEAGPAARELPLEVISEARVDQDGKTFFVLETKVAHPENERNRGKTCIHKIYPFNPQPLKKQKE